MTVNSFTSRNVARHVTRGPLWHPCGVRLLSTRELATAIGVSESSLKRWIDAGRLTASRTEGGHRRVALAEAMRFIREQRAAIARPEILDLPEIGVARSRGATFATYLLDGDHVAARGYLIERFLAGTRIAELADGPIRDAMHALGELWHHDAGGIVTEHRGTDVCLQAVSHLRSLLAPPPTGAPIAIGGAPSGDPYLLPTLLAGLTTAEAGMQSINLGPDTPRTALEAAVATHRPKLIWVSVTVAVGAARVGELASWMEKLPRGVTIVVGGQQALALEKLPARVHRIASMSQLAQLAGG